MFDIIFRFIVMYVRFLNYISAAIKMFKWNETKRGSGVWYISSVTLNTVRKIAVAEASWLTLSSTLLYAELPDLCRSSVGDHTPESKGHCTLSPKFSHAFFRILHPFLSKCIQRMQKRRESNLIQKIFDGQKFRRQCANVIDTTWGRIYFLTCENFGWKFRTQCAETLTHEVRTTEDASPKFNTWYWEMRAYLTLCHQTIWLIFLVV